MLMGRLPRDPTWLREVAAVADADVDAIAGALADAQRAALLVFARWVLVMTNFERALYADPDADLDTLWWDLVEHHQLLHRPDDRPARGAPDWAAKIHLAAAPVYYQNYLYGELFASQLDATLRDRAGGLVDRAAAGALLRDDVFAPGASLRWDALVERATGEPLSAEHMARAADGQVIATNQASDGSRAARTGHGGGGRHPRRRARHRRAARAPRARAVAVLARTPSHLREAEEELLAAGAEDAIGLECDLLDTGEVEAAFTFLDERWGECHALVNTVGPAHVGGLDDLTDAAWLDEFDLGVLTMVRTTRAALPLLRQATFARVVNVAASSIRHQSPGLIGFTASKAAMASASKNLSRALAPEGIIVNTVAPGTVMSPTLASYLVGTDLEGLPEGPLEAAYEAIARDYGASNDIGRVGLPEEVATMVVFLCSELCSFVVGATVPVDGGTDFF